MKTVYYSDTLNDDFAENNIDTRTLTEDFPFIHRSVLWRAIEFFMYYCFAIPIVFTVSKLYLGLKFENRKALKKLRGQGWFLYCNHTRALDAFVPSMAAWPNKAFVTCSPDAVSIKGIGWLVQMLGGLPIPGGIKPMKRFMSAVDRRYEEKKCVAVFPEAHIWPFFTEIRPFSDASFRYPAKLGAPTVAMATTYRKRRGLFLWCRKPAMTVHVSEPFYPDPSLPRREAQKKLRDQVYNFMCTKAAEPGNVEYIKYVHLPEPEEKDA